MVVGVAMTAFFIIDSLAWLASGKGLAEEIGGSQPPMLGAIARHLAWMPMWAFWSIVALAVVVLSTLIAVGIVAMYRKELTS